MNLIVSDVDGTLIPSTGVDDECFAQAIEVAWGIPNISTQWDDYEYVTDSGIATELCRKHFGREPERAKMESLQQEFLSQLVSTVSGAKHVLPDFAEPSYFSDAIESASIDVA